MLSSSVFDFLGRNKVAVSQQETLEQVNHEQDKVFCAQPVYGVSLRFRVLDLGWVSVLSSV